MPTHKESLLAAIKFAQKAGLPREHLANVEDLKNSILGRKSSHYLDLVNRENGVYDFGTLTLEGMMQDAPDDLLDRGLSDEHMARALEAATRYGISDAALDALKQEIFEDAKLFLQEQETHPGQETASPTP